MHMFIPIIISYIQVRMHIICTLFTLYAVYVSICIIRNLYIYYGYTVYCAHTIHTAAVDQVGFS